MPRRSSARLRELVAGASAFLAVGFEQPELGQGFEVAAGGVVGAPGQVRAAIWRTFAAKALYCMAPGSVLVYSFQAGIAQSQTLSGREPAGVCACPSWYSPSLLVQLSAIFGVE